MEHLLYCIQKLLDKQDINNHSYHFRCFCENVDEKSSPKKIILISLKMLNQEALKHKIKLGSYSNEILQELLIPRQAKI